MKFIEDEDDHDWLAPTLGRDILTTVVAGGLAAVLITLAYLAVKAFA